MLGAPDCALDDAIVTMRPQRARACRHRSLDAVEVPVRLTARSGPCAGCDARSAIERLDAALVKGSRRAQLRHGSARMRGPPSPVTTSTSTAIAVASSAATRLPRRRLRALRSRTGHVASVATRRRRRDRCRRATVTAATRVIGRPPWRELEVHLGEPSSTTWVRTGSGEPRADRVLLDRRMSRRRSTMRSMLTRLRPGPATARAGVGTSAERDVRLGVGSIDVELVRHSNRRGPRLAAAVEQHDGCACRDVDPPTSSHERMRRKSVFTGSRYAAPLDEVGDLLVVLGSSSCSSGCSARCFNAAASSRAVVSWPAANKKVAVRTTGCDVKGVVPSDTWEPARCVSTSLRGSRPAVSMYRREPVVEPSERVSSSRAGRRRRSLPGSAQAEELAEPLMILSGTPRRSATTSIAKGWAYLLMTRSGSVGMSSSSC